MESAFTYCNPQRQLAVIKGQAYNVVQSLKHDDEGPLELTRRQNMLVWDDEVEVAEDTFVELLAGPKSASPKPSVKTLPVSLPTSPRHQRTLSQGAADGPSLNGRGFPPPVRPRSRDARPVPFVTKLPRVHPGTSGVTVLEHMERVDAVEAGLRRLASDEDVIVEEDEEEEDVAVAASARLGHRPSTIREDAHEDEHEHDEGSRTPTAASPIASPVISPGSELAEAGGKDSLASSMTEEDLVTMSASMSAMDSRAVPLHMRFSSQDTPGASGSTRPNLDWIREETVDKKRIMINEVCFTSTISTLQLTYGAHLNSA